MLSEAEWQGFPEGTKMKRLSVLSIPRVFLCFSSTSSKGTSSTLGFQGDPINLINLLRTTSAAQSHRRWIVPATIQKATRIPSLKRLIPVSQKGKTFQTEHDIEPEPFTLATCSVSIEALFNVTHVETISFAISIL